jgi:hypothetical protein
MTAPVVEHFSSKIERSDLMRSERRGFIGGQRYQQVFLHAVDRRSISSLIRGASPLGLPDWLAPGGPTPRSARQAHSLSIVRAVYEMASSGSVRVLTDVTLLDGVVSVHHEVLCTIPEVRTDCQQRLVPRVGGRRVRAFRPFQPLRDMRRRDEEVERCIRVGWVRLQASVITMKLQEQIFGRLKVKDTNEPVRHVAILCALTTPRAGAWKPNLA